MIVSHPDVSILKRFLRGDLTAEDRRSVVRHLIGGCTACRSLAGEFWQAPGGANRPRSTRATPKAVMTATSVAEPAEYQAAIDHAVRAVRDRRPALAEARKRTPELLVELLAVEPEQRLSLAQGDPRFAIPALCAAILALRSAGETAGASSAPLVAPRELADLGLAIAERLDAAKWGTSIVRDLEARAWAHRGDVAREAGSGEEAQRAFRMAHSLYALSSQDPWDWAEISRFEARFELSRGYAEAATALGLEAATLYRKLGERDLLAVTLAEVGPMAVRARRPDLAVSALLEAVELFDPVRESRRLAGCLHWLGALLVRTERARESLGHLWRARSLYERLGEPEEVLRVRWIEARAALALGSLAEGEKALLSVRGHLLVAGLSQDAAGVLLDLSQLYLSQGRMQEMGELFEEIFLPYRTRDLESGTIGALLMLRRAVETDCATLELVHELANYLAACRPIFRPG